MTEVAIETRSLGKQYRKLWALKDFSVSLPANKVIALVGANGAGKSTLMSIAAGILPASQGEIHVNGRVVLLSQEKPLYRSFRVAEMLAFGRHLNRTWDQQRALTWLSRFDIPLDRPCGKLSGGQQTQVAMAVALGARPSVLLLDEPLADLDPVARRDVIGELLAEVAESDMTVVLSTHVVAELADVGDHLLLLSQGHSRLDGDVEELLAQHTRLTGPRADTPPIDGEVVQTQYTERQSTFVIRTLLGADTPVAEPWQALPVTLEDLVLAYLKPNRSLGEEL
ncbi:ABC transporter ATP-binding protein [Catenulispora pinisilvae]|uniref:ABC transporter ATP-binding protein n=1 Tax=Catenulispora pinisilvae TaxID=2705253 RepID=UPI001892760F|nr:ABC transporter ATP-binding protein [Catenulispora pinisilvae]